MKIHNPTKTAPIRDYQLANEVEIPCQTTVQVRDDIAKVILEKYPFLQVVEAKGTTIKETTKKLIKGKKKKL